MKREIIKEAITELQEHGYKVVKEGKQTEQSIWGVSTVQRDVMKPSQWTKLRSFINEINRIVSAVSGTTDMEYKKYLDLDRKLSLLVVNMRYLLKPFNKDFEDNTIDRKVKKACGWTDVKNGIVSKYVAQMKQNWKEIAELDFVEITHEPNFNQNFDYSVISVAGSFKFKNVDPSIIKFSYEDCPAFECPKSYTHGGYLHLGYGTIGRRGNEVETPTWTHPSSNHHNWPVKATAKTMTEIYKFIVDNWEVVQEECQLESDKQDAIAQDIANYKGSNWSGD